MTEESLAGLYCHVPFCARICPYCDFAVRLGRDELKERYVESLLDEVLLYEGYLRRFDTIYFGGGTPSSLRPEQLARLIEGLRAGFDFAEETRVFLEANPEDVAAASLEAWRNLGVETLSLGVQALQAEALDFLGRAHTVEQARESVARAKAAGFRTVSIDLIYGLPDQSLDQWSEDIDRALELEPDHVSCYQLTIHSQTRFGLMRERAQLVPQPNDRQGEFFRLTHRRFNEAGLRGYEVSQFARSEDHRSRHNAKYWDHTPYLGLGPSAHSYDDHRRWWNERKLRDWQRKIDPGVRPIAGEERLDAGALALESLMTGLRTYAGVDLGAVERKFGVALLEPNRERIERFVLDGLVEIRDDRVVPTLDGLAVADRLVVQLEIADR